MIFLNERKTPRIRLFLRPRLVVRTEMAAKVDQQAPAAFERYRADFSQERRLWQHREKPQPNQGRPLEPAGGKFLVSHDNHFVKAINALVELGADAANQEIAERRQSLEQNNGTILDLAVSLGQRGQGNVAFSHGRKSAEVYSGSFSP